MDSVFTANDIYEIQECLGSYKLLLDWVPATSREDIDLKYIKQQIVNHIINKCDRVLKRMKDE